MDYKTSILIAMKMYQELIKDKNFSNSEKEEFRHKIIRLNEMLEALK